MPNLFNIGRYKIFFWSNENNEPIHVHVAIGNPSANTSKIWLTSNGGCIVANNVSRIPQKDLNHLLKIIQADYFSICNKWKNYFSFEEIKYYC